MLDGLILLDRSRKSLNFGERWAAERGWSSVTIRRDYGRRDAFQGGMLLTWKEFSAVVQSDETESIFFALEPCDARDNDYNVSVRVDQDDLIAEVVGPGFDISDLQRGHSVPHEIFSVSRPDLSNAHIVRSFCISAADYDRSVRYRREKVLAKYVNKTASYIPRGDLVDLDWTPPFSYSGIPRAKLRRVIAGVRRAMEITDAVFPFPYTMASSFLEGGRRLIFWDVFSGDGRSF